MAVSSIQLGQVWRSDADGQDYLVTKVYSEVFTQYAMLRPAGITAPDAPTVRVKSSRRRKAQPSPATHSPRKARSRHQSASPISDTLATGHRPLATVSF